MDKGNMLLERFVQQDFIEKLFPEEFEEIPDSECVIRDKKTGKKYRTMYDYQQDHPPQKGEYEYSPLNPNDRVPWVHSDGTVLIDCYGDIYE